MYSICISFAVVQSFYALSLFHEAVMAEERLRQQYILHKEKRILSKRMVNIVWIPVPLPTFDRLRPLNDETKGLDLEQL